MPWTRTAAVSEVVGPTASTSPPAGSGHAESGTAAVQQAASFATASSSNIMPLTGTELERDGSVLEELQLIGAVDPIAAQQLVTRLQDVKPSLRPLVARQFRTSWQYHRELAGADSGTMLSGRSAEPITHTASLPAEYQPPTTSAMPPLHPAAQTQSPPSQLAQPPAPRPAVEAATPNPPPAASPQAAAIPAEQTVNEVVPASYDASPKLMPVADDASAEVNSEEVALASDPSSSTMEVETPRDWEDALSQTIDQLAATSVNDPRNTDEAYQHVRLRLLRLVAGEKDNALEPIPGLTPTEQAYWSNQFFAIATLLEHDTHPDDEQRASLAAAQLAEASAKLGELSNLSIRGMVFCEKVYGYGDYEKLPEDAFKPGQSVTLYAEIDNFRSESTEKGYHTSLATSYEVLDQAGNRVEGGEFANVDDLCSNKRQDFYIEYTFQLPSRIYASKYQLRLLIRDRLSGKIGKSTVEFEIKE